MADIKILNPDVLGKPLGQYSQITRVKAGEYLFIAGQLAADLRITNAPLYQLSYSGSTWTRDAKPDPCLVRARILRDAIGDRQRDLSPISGLQAVRPGAAVESPCRCPRPPCRWGVRAAC